MANRPPVESDPGAPPDDVLDRMTDGFFALDESWRFTYLNERGRGVVAAATGDAANEARDFVGQHIWDVLPEAEGTVFGEEYEHAMETQEPTDFEAYYEPLGEWFSVRAYPSESGLSVYFQQVTDEHNRESRLREREQVLRDVHEAMAADRPFVDRVESLLDVGREVLGLGYGTLSRIEGDTYVFEVVSGRDDAIESGDTVPLEATNCERTAATDQTLVLADVASEAPELTDRAGFTEMGITCYVGTPVYAGGELYGTFCFYDTDPREEPFSEWEVTLVDLLGKWVSYGLDRELAEEELEAKNERLEEFAMTVSHDLRNPLSVASGNVDLARTSAEAGSLDDAADALARMDDIISDLLDVAQESVPAQRDTLDVAALAADVWGHIDGPGTLTVEDGLVVDANPGSMKRLLENLFVNATEHGSDDAAGPAVTVGSLPDGFFVADDGPGIPEADRDAVFESGYSSAPDGTGFGLSIVRRIADEHDWSVTVTEGDAGGARFEFATAG